MKHDRFSTCADKPCCRARLRLHQCADPGPWWSCGEMPSSYVLVRNEHPPACFHKLHSSSFCFTSL